jgi:phage terminase small subunit
MNATLLPNLNHKEVNFQARNQIQSDLPFNATDWLAKSGNWDKEKFVLDLTAFIKNTQGHNAYPNTVLIGLLTHQIDIYVQCTHQIEQSGLIEAYNKGATFGPSIHFSIADKALNRILQLMKELGLTPSHRIGSVKSIDTETLEIEELFAGH